MNQQFHPPYHQVVLMILDGWGYTDATKYNAIASAHPEFFQQMWHTYAHTLLPASGEAVGLPEGTIGTSEIGHMSIGAGRTIFTDLLRINKAIKDGSLATNPVIAELFAHVKKNNSTLHLIGLVSPGGVHSHQEHLFAILRLARSAGLMDVAIHVITDGRDTPPQSALTYVAELEKVMTETGIGRIASISGRYFAMDRDNNFDRIQKMFDVLFQGIGMVPTSTDPIEIIKAEYAANTGDEFIMPIVLKDPSGKPNVIKQNDGVFFFNFRPDRARELSQKIMEMQPHLSLDFVTMTRYDESINSHVAFPPEKIETSLAAEISKAGLTQIHIAETEKYAHVTYFLNGGDEKEHNGEHFVMIPSRKDIPTHDLAPEMKAKEITDKTVEAINAGTNFIALNFANADMVGHTGKWEPTIAAVKFLDGQIRRIVEAIEAKGGIAFITADHGNAEVMFDEAHNQPHTAHTLNPVPAILTATGITLHAGTFADIAPTILSLFNLPIPPIMTGHSLITPNS